MRQRFLTLTIAGLVACGPASNATSPSAAPSSAATEFHFAVGAGVRPDEETQIRAAIAASATYLRATFGRTREDAVINIVASRTADPRPAPADSGCCVAVAGGSVYLDTDGAGWPAASADKMKAAAHEYIHTFQDGLGGPFGCIGRDDDNPKRTPVWFYEGWAEYLAYQVALRNGWYSQSAVTAVIQRAKADAAATTLRMISVPPLRGARGLYTLGWVAADRLTSLGGATGVRDFCIAVGRGGRWQDEFRQTFGIDPEAFLDTFNAYVLAR